VEGNAGTFYCLRGGSDYYRHYCQDYQAKKMKMGAWKPFITVSFTHRDELIRIFSARDASSSEVREYNNGIKNFFGE
jgi:hypothetical protein